MPWINTYHQKTSTTWKETWRRRPLNTWLGEVMPKVVPIQQDAPTVEPEVVCTSMWQLSMNVQRINCIRSKGVTRPMQCWITMIDWNFSQPCTVSCDRLCTTTPHTHTKKKKRSWITGWAYATQINMAGCLIYPSAKIWMGHTHTHLSTKLYPA